MWSTLARLGALLFLTAKALRKPLYSLSLETIETLVCSVLIYPYGSHLPVTCLPGGTARPLGILFCIAVSLPCFKTYTNEVHLNTFHAATQCQPTKERCDFLKISPWWCVCLFFLPLLVLHCRSLEPFPAALGRSYGYTLGRSPWTATIHTHIHTYRHFRGAN